MDRIDAEVENLARTFAAPGCLERIVGIIKSGTSDQDEIDLGQSAFLIVIVASKQRLEGLMQAQPSMDKHRSALKGLLQRWRDRRNADFRFDSQCEQWEIERMAQDVGMSASELRTVARLGPEAADLLYGRMLALEIDRSEVARSQPQALRDMQRVCAHCDCRNQRARDLAHNGSNPAWQHYCPNAETLRELSALPWLSRKES